MLLLLLCVAQAVTAASVFRDSKEAREYDKREIGQLYQM